MESMSSTTFERTQRVAVLGGGPGGYEAAVAISEASDLGVNFYAKGENGKPLKPEIAINLAADVCSSGPRSPWSSGWASADPPCSPTSCPRRA